MVTFVKMKFKDNDSKERTLYEEMEKTFKKMAEKVIMGDLRVSCINYDEDVLWGDTDLPKDLYGEIIVEFDDIYEDYVMKNINGTEAFVNWLCR